VLIYLTFTVSAFILLAVALVIYGIYWFMTGTNVDLEGGGRLTFPEKEPNRNKER